MLKKDFDSVIKSLNKKPTFKQERAKLIKELLQDLKVWTSKEATKNCLWRTILGYKLLLRRFKTLQKQDFEKEVNIFIKELDELIVK